MAIGDAGLVTLAPALRQRPALVILDLNGNPFGDEGLAALVAPSPPAGAPLPSIRGLTELRQLNLSQTQVTDAGCATIYSASDSGALPVLVELYPFWCSCPTRWRRILQIGYNDYASQLACGARLAGVHSASVQHQRQLQLPGQLRTSDVLVALRLRGLTEHRSDFIGLR